MSIARFSAQIVGCLLVLAVVIGVYNFGARILVNRVISQAKNSPPFPTSRVETNFDSRQLEGLRDGFLYKPGPDGSSHRFGDR